jgi:hypothetical protein
LKERGFWTWRFDKLAIGNRQLEIVNELGR